MEAQVYYHCRNIDNVKNSVEFLGIMKAQNLNNSSKKTRKLIKKTFAKMLSEKKELGKISVSELCKRADISRGTFYCHYDDIYGVAEDYENELIDAFFDNARLIGSVDIMNFIDSIFEFIRQNNENYRLLCRSNDFIFAAKKLTAIASGKLLQLSLEDARIIKKEYLELDLTVFLEGLFCEYVKYCRGYCTRTLDDLYSYTKYWVSNFIKQRSE